MMGIIGSTRYASDNPTLQPYVVPTQPLIKPSLPANPTAAQIRTLTDEKKLLNRDGAVVRGFCRGVSEKIRNALDLEFLE